MEGLEENEPIRQPQARFDLTQYKIPKIPQSVWDDEDKKWVVDDPEASMTKIISNPKMELHKQDIINKMVGSQQKDLFKDSDKDKVPNIFDYDPKDKKVQNPFDKNFKSLIKKKIDFNKKIKNLI